MPAGDDDLSLDFDDLMRDRFLCGAPAEIAEQIAGYGRRLGVTTLILGMHWVGMPHAQVMESMRLFAEEVAPLVAGAS